MEKFNKEINDEEKFDVIQINSNSTDILIMKAKKKVECYCNRWSCYIKRNYFRGLSVSYF